MYRPMLTLIAALLLTACQKPAPPQPDGSTHGAATATQDPEVTPAPEPSTDTSATADTTSDVSAVNTAIDRVLGEHAPYEIAVKQLQQAVADHDATAVAALVQYPLDVTIDGSKMLVKDTVEFVRLYDRIVTTDIAAAITGTRYEDLMVSQRGIMFGAGEAWINGVCADTACSHFVPKIIAIQATTATRR